MESCGIPLGQFYRNCMQYQLLKWVWKLEHDMLSQEAISFRKNSNFAIFSKTQHKIHLLKLVDKMCKHEMDLASIVEDTERTWFLLQTERRTKWNQYTPLKFVGRGYNHSKYYIHISRGPMCQSHLRVCQVRGSPPQNPGYQRSQSLRTGCWACAHIVWK